jgi:hypothetical protein
MKNSVIKHPNQRKVTLYNYKSELSKVTQHKSKPAIFILTRNAEGREGGEPCLNKDGVQVPAINSKGEKRSFTSFSKGYGRILGSIRTVANNKE